MPQEPQRVFVYTTQTSQEQVTYPVSQSATLTERFAWLAGTGAAPRPPLGDEFTLFADESLAWAEQTLAAVLETWPGDDWPAE
jgi:hypothetical protein